MSEYVYDLMNRLEKLTHYAPDATPEDLSDNAVLQKFEYARYLNGMKSSETFTDADGNVINTSWLYDNLGRLVQENLDHSDNNLDAVTRYMFDLVGNRLEKATDKNGDGVFEEVVRSLFDANDRLLSSLKQVDGVSTEETTYGYNATEQALKRVVDLLTGEVTSETAMEYNLQGRMSKLSIDSYLNGVREKTVVQEFSYNDEGIKVTQTEKVDENADGTFEHEKLTKYLTDALNHTGYAQVLEEHISEDGTERVITYTIGHSVLSQFTAANGLLTLLADGHGSTRAVSGQAGDILEQYLYDAYGNAIGFDPAAALTNILYSGEQFNPVAGLQYLRARWYDPSSGRFNRLDPYAGNVADPLSLHKYAYTHNNPINGIDPSGMWNLSISTCVSTISAMIRTMAIPSLKTAVSFIAGTIARAAIGGLIGAALGALDARLVDGWTWDDIWSGAVNGFAVGVAFGALAPLIPVKVALGIIVGTTAYGTTTSVINGEYYQALFRLGTGIAFGILAFRAGNISSKSSSNDISNNARTPWKYGKVAEDSLGETDPLGNITIRPGLRGTTLRETVRHESVHRFFSPKYGAFRDVRANLRMKAYSRSHLLRYIEEAMAETYATRDLSRGMKFPLEDGYDISVLQMMLEAIGYTGIVGGASYAGYHASQEGDSE